MTQITQPFQIIGVMTTPTRDDQPVTLSGTLILNPDPVTSGTETEAKEPETAAASKAKK
jgi:hypothetical protein